LVERYGPTVRPLQSIGYLQVLEHLQGAATLAETEPRIVQATRVYARRQRTWGKTDPDIALRMTPAQAREPAVLERIRMHLAGP
jgi:tRNA A37 N6-isopentenylltransferase MiaA